MQGGYFWMRSDPAQAKASVDTLVRSMRRAWGFDASADAPSLTAFTQS